MEGLILVVVLVAACCGRPLLIGFLTSRGRCYQMAGNEAVLTEEEGRVVAFLLEQWRQPFRITTIQQALDTLGLSSQADARLRVGRYLAANPGVHEKVERWGAVPFILTEDEKLLARAVGHDWRHSAQPRPVEELARLVGQPVPRIEAGLCVLGELALLSLHDGTYAVPDDMEERAGGLGCNFHTVVLQSGERFNVP